MKIKLYYQGTEPIIKNGYGKYYVTFVAELSKQQYDALIGATSDAHDVDVDLEEV